jgi:transcription initiation factor IIE alpha subunit
MEKGILIYKFNCDCGCTKLTREEFMKKWNYLEGHFNCEKCKREVNYYDDKVEFSIVKEAVQLTIW